MREADKSALGFVLILLKFMLNKDDSTGVKVLHQSANDTGEEPAMEQQNYLPEKKVQN